MKKIVIYLLALLTCSGAFTACGDDKKRQEPDVPPTLGDIAKTYTADNLNAQLNSKDVPANAAVDIVVGSDNSVSFKLTNIIPGVRSFTIPNMKHDFQTKSAYYSVLSGSIEDNVLGYSVSIEGRIEGEILTIAVKQSEMNGKPDAGAKTFRSLIVKGDMNVDAAGTPVTALQRVYTAAPEGDDPAMLKLEIPNFEIQGKKLGTLTLDAIQVIKRGEVYGLVALNRKLTLNPVGEVTLDARGGFIQNGDNASLQLYLAINTAAGMVYADFKGVAVKESTNATAVIKITGDAIAEAIAFNNNANAPKYTFKVWEDTPASKWHLTPEITLPEGATLDSVILYNAGDQKVQSLEKNKVIDFSQVLSDSYIGYHVTAQDIRVTSLTKLFVKRLPIISVFDMSEWVDDGNGRGWLTPKGLSNSNAAANLYLVLGINFPTPVVKASDNAAEITSFRTVSTIMPTTLVPALTAGVMFIGNYTVLDIMNLLTSTRFGAAHKQKPVTFKFTYKYAPGSTFYKTVVREGKFGPDERYHDTEVVPGAVDLCSISAYLYEVNNYDEYLDGTNITTSPKVILKASFAGGVKSSYETKEIPFVATGNGTYNPAKKYKIAIVCSSSQRGDEFMGADGSKLWVKYLEIK